MAQLLSSRHGDDVPYLFRSRTGVVEFLLIQDELEALNEFCVTCDAAAANALSESREALAKHLDDADGCYYAGVALSEEASGWDWANSTVLSGVVLLVLFAAVEKHLRLLCSLNWSGDEVKRIRPLPGEAKIEAYVRYLQVERQVRFAVPEITRAAITSARRLRNDFAHGEWAAIEKELSDFDETRAFAAAKALYEAIEDARVEKPGE